jgi:hypothetical protein
MVAVLDKIGDRALPLAILLVMWFAFGLVPLFSPKAAQRILIALAPFGVRAGVRAARSPGYLWVLRLYGAAVTLGSLWFASKILSFP